MLYAVRNYLLEQEYTDIYIDFHPEGSDAFIALYCWQKMAATLHDGTADHLVQVRVRRDDHAEAMRVCNDIVELLDSGSDERLIPLPHPGAVIGRVRRLPVVMERQENTVTVYAEIALWGMT